MQEQLYWWWRRLWFMRHLTCIRDITILIKLLFNLYGLLYIIYMQFLFSQKGIEKWAWPFIIYEVVLVQNKCWQSIQNHEKTLVWPIINFFCQYSTFSIFSDNVQGNPTFRGYHGLLHESGTYIFWHMFIDTITNTLSKKFLALKFSPRFTRYLIIFPDYTYRETLLYYISPLSSYCTMWLSLPIHSLESCATV